MILIYIYIIKLLTHIVHSYGKKYVSSNLEQLICSHST